MTKRTEALSAAYHQFQRDHNHNPMTEEQFVCYALDAMQKLDAVNTPPDPAEPSIILHISEAEVRPGIPPLDDSIKCGEHPHAQVVQGFGLAGGGMGPYTSCAECGKILSKSDDAE